MTALCRICEPIAFMSIFPYIYYMIASFKITSSDNEIAIYAGMVTSAFAFAEFSSGVVWGRLSDKVGRKPVLIGGLAGTGLSMIIFGFAPNLPVALVGRALGGLLNGYVALNSFWLESPVPSAAYEKCPRNIGVLQTTVAEMITVKEHQRECSDWVKSFILGRTDLSQLGHTRSCHLYGVLGECTALYVLV